MHRRPSLCKLIRSTFFAIAVCAVCAAAAQPVLPGSAQIGMTAEQLREAVPALKRVARPQRMTGGLVGSWSGPATDIAGVSFTPTYYFSGDVLQRIEYVASPGDAAKAFDAVRAWGRANWSSELASQSPEGDYAAWSAQDMNVYLQMTASARPGLRLVLKRRVDKDPSEL
jgi:hypothetical protein